MNYKETLFFVAKCLTISHEEENKKLVEEKIVSGSVNWDNVVKLSTSHFVFPALYCNLKRADFLQYLPNDLVEYMQHITQLNRERNEQIIKQAKEINQLLLDNGITPIFLKGTGNLLEGLYEDIAERMVGDIDFLVSKKDFKPCIQVLKKNGYLEKTKDFLDNTILNRHYPKITKEGKIAALEVHYKMITNEKYFNYKSIIQNIKLIQKNISILSYSDQVLMTSYNKQINDKGQWYKNISLRNSYDLFLVSKHTNVKNTLERHKSSQNKYLINFLASSSLIFNLPKSLYYEKTPTTNNFLKKQLNFIETPSKSSFNKRLWDFLFLYKNRFSVLLYSFYNKEYRKYLSEKLFKN
ncbi:nucleotidyltransferase family protein [Tenacibaculum sp. 190524A02b]|uniref:nucleotidyltransferase domain-containing protein n=1 Tax=Tenacibaculum vairaonense TaxID=3137860 RepID=UPI0031FA83A5